MFVPVVEKQEQGKLYSGQKICHDQYGRGIIIGFDSLTDDPVAFFYEPDMQINYHRKVIIVASEDIFY